ncbi:MAG: peptidoglycan-binding protein, partial [Candidatus Pacebacteria bacterium]|nr:peptidoglycan-binding protein [Candidatus Paceibacterota bacterium]
NIPETVCAAPFTDAVTSDSDKNTIILLQEFLAYNLDRDITENGLFGTQTRQALKDFQTKEGITVATSATVATIDAINNRCLGIIEEKARAQDPIEMPGVFLTENIIAMSISPNSERLVYFTQKGENTIAVTLDFATRALKQIFTSPFSEWAPRWTSDTKITLHTKPSGLVNGFLYSLDADTGFLHKYDDLIPGLSGIMSPSAEKIFISGSTNNVIVNKVLEVATGEDPIVSLKTLPEKCVWSSDAINIYCAVPEFIGRGLYPDDWYKGSVVFSDSIWSLNTVTGETRQIADLSREGGQSFDVIKPTLEINELYMLFINKITGEPWILEL